MIKDDPIKDIEHHSVFAKSMKNKKITKQH